MKYLVVLFICIGLCQAGRGGTRGSRGNRGRMVTKPTSKPGKGYAGKDYIASILQLPNIYHSCNAFFVTEDILVAPASCVLCDQNCNFQVAIHAMSAFDTAKFIRVKNITMHPKFLKYSSRGNPSYNIALVKLSERVTSLEPLVISKYVYSKEGYFRSWTFNKEMTDFHLKAYSFEKVTHYICDETEVKVKVDEVCIQGLDAVELGKFNEGTVFVIDGDDSGSRSSAMAFYAKGSTLLRASRYYAFISIPYYYEWLNQTISELSH